VREIQELLPEKSIMDIWAFKKEKDKGEAKPEVREERRRQEAHWQTEAIREDIARMRKLEAASEREEVRDTYADLRRGMELNLHWLEGTKSTALHKEIDDTERSLPEDSPRRSFYQELRKCMQGEDRARMLPELYKEQLWELHTKLRSKYGREARDTLKQKGVLDEMEAQRLGSSDEERGIKARVEEVVKLMRDETTDENTQYIRDNMWRVTEIKNIRMLSRIREEVIRVRERHEPTSRKMLDLERYIDERIRAAAEIKEMIELIANEENEREARGEARTPERAMEIGRVSQEYEEIYEKKFIPMTGLLLFPEPDENESGRAKRRERPSRERGRMILRQEEYSRRRNILRQDTQAGGI
jgi:hypothetical protein